MAFTHEGTDFDRLGQSNFAASRGCTWDPVSNPDGSKIANSSSTAMVARDLIGFAESHGEWQDKQASLLSADQATRHALK